MKAKKILISLSAILMFTVLTFSFIVLIQNDQLIMENQLLIDEYNKLAAEYNKLVGQNSIGGISSLGYNITATVWIYHHDKLIYYYSGPDPFTTIAENLTIQKWTGNVTYFGSMTAYLYNCSWVSIGNGTCSASTTYLPWEWDRVAASQTALTSTSFNMTATFTPPVTPPASVPADVMGINYQSLTANTSDLFAYFPWTSQVTGIDNTFTITINIEVSLATS